MLRPKDSLDNGEEWYVLVVWIYSRGARHDGGISNRKNKGEKKMTRLKEKGVDGASRHCSREGRPAVSTLSAAVADIIAVWVEVATAAAPVGLVAEKGLGRSFSHDECERNRVD